MHYPYLSQTLRTFCVGIILLAGLSTQSLAEEKLSQSKFVTLGTNSGPILNPDCVEPANVLLYDDQVVVVDAGDAVAWQLAKAGVPIGKVTSVFLTHLHFDHTGGLFGLISQRFQINTQGILTIYGPEGTAKMVKGLTDAMAPVADKHGWMLSRIQNPPAEYVKVIELKPTDKLTLGKATVSTSTNSHYIIAQDDGDTLVRTLSFRFDLADRSIVYTGDTGPSKDVEQLALGADVLVTEIMDPDVSFVRIVEKAKKDNAGATKANAVDFASGAIKDHFSRQHLSPDEVGQLAKKAKVKTLVVTHNALPDELLDEAREKISKHFNGEIHFAQDLDTF